MYSHLYGITLPSFYYNKPLGRLWGEGCLLSNILGESLLAPSTLDVRYKVERANCLKRRTPFVCMMFTGSRTYIRSWCIHSESSFKAHSTTVLETEVILRRDITSEELAIRRSLFLID